MTVCLTVFWKSTSISQFTGYTRNNNCGFLLQQNGKSDKHKATLTGIFFITITNDPKAVHKTYKEVTSCYKDDWCFYNLLENVYIKFNPLKWYFRAILWLHSSKTQRLWTENMTELWVSGFFAKQNQQKEKKHVQHIYNNYRWSTNCSEEDLYQGYEWVWKWVQITYSYLYNS